MAILCCMCGTSIEPNGANMCPPCLSTEVDIAEGISREERLTQCKGCLQYLTPKGIFTECSWESTELMALCLKRIHGLSKVKLIDANFIWTEPHSKRVKLKLTIQKEAIRQTILQKSFVVTFVVDNLKCPECSKQYHNNTWKGLIQIRQKVNHKRTFYHLEQIILKHSAHKNAIGIQNEKDGMDFFFSEKNSAERFSQFILQRVPAKLKVARKLISSDNHNNTANVKTTTVVEIAPLCKDDLVVLPKRIAKQLGGFPSLVLVSRVTTQIHIVDPFTCQRTEITADKYWKFPFDALETSPYMVEFIVLDVEPVYNNRSNAHSEKSDQRTEKEQVLAEIEVARSSDFGQNDKTFRTLSHLGHLLNAGDTVMGYDLSNCNFSTRMTYNMNQEFPDIVLVKRIYPREMRKPVKKLKSLGARQNTKASKMEMEKEDKEYGDFVYDYQQEMEYTDQDSVEALEDDAIDFTELTSTTKPTFQETEEVIFQETEQVTLEDIKLSNLTI